MLNTDGLVYLSAEDPPLAPLNKGGKISLPFNKGGLGISVLSA